MEQTKQAGRNNSAPFETASISPVARVGDPMSAIDTPSLVLDLDAFEENLRAMQVLAERHGVALRPHAKAHRCPEIALRQVALGAQGICCQKVTEAVPFMAAGLRDIHISNEIVGEAKLALLARLAKQGRLTICADNPRNVHALSAMMVEHDAQIGVLVDIDVGQKRCGVQSLEQAISLATLIQSLPGLRFEGIQAYHGGLQHKRRLGQRQKAADRTAKLVSTYVNALAAAGLECRVVTGGGTGTAAFDVASQVYTEVQSGTYAFMDTDYGSLDWGEALGFRHSLFLYATVMSTPTPERAVLDLGLKSTSAESGVPQPVGISGLRCTAVHDEHSLLVAAHKRDRPGLGAKIMLVPSHCDPTFNLHDCVVAVRAGHVEAIWPISARGLSR